MGRQMSAEIIAIGSELLLGDIVNTNAQFIAKELSCMGINVHFQSVVGDNKDRLEQCLNIAKERADIIITTGGLGPTYDDLSKETIAKNFNRELVLNQEVLNKIESFFKRVKREMTPNNAKQAYMPKDCIIFDNHYGTAPGCAIEGDDGKIAIMLPGPPSEMKPMFLNHAMAYLSKFCDGVIASKTIYTIGIGESALETKLYDLMKNSTNPTVAPYAKDGECILRVTASAPTKEQAIEMIDPVVEEIYKKVGIYIYGVDIGSIEAAVVKLLAEKGIKVALAESCSGGLVAKRITDIPGASEIFDIGIVAYSNEIKNKILGVDEFILEEYGAVSKQCAVQMAKGMYNLSGNDLAVSITGVAGPSESEDKKAGLVYMALYDGQKTWVKTIDLPRQYRAYIRIVSANYALDMIRRYVINNY